MEFPQKIKNKTTILPVIPFLGIYIEKIKTLIQKDVCTPMFIAGLFTIVKILKQLKGPSINEWVKMWYTYTMVYYSVIK